MAKSKPTDIEKLRIRMGLSGPQMLTAIGAKPSHRSLLYGAFAVDPLFSHQADELYHDFVSWRTEVMSHFPEPDEEFGTYEVSRVLDMSQWNILQLILRKVIMPCRSTGRQHLFNRKSIEDLFTYNARALQDVGDGRRRGPLATPFLAWRKRTKRDRSLRFAAFKPEDRQIEDPFALYDQLRRGAASA